MKNGRKTRWVAAVIVALAFAASLGAVAFAQVAQTTVEGQGDYFVTGESFPTKIQMAGYDSKNKKLYLNFDLETTKLVDATQTATFNYFVEVFDGNGAVLGTVGSYDVPETVSGTAGAKTATVTNKAVTLSNFTAAYRAIVTVKEVIIQ